MNLKPLYDRVVVKPIEADEVSAGGIVIPDNAKEKPTKGEVVAIGEGKALDNGQLRAPKVKVGDQVIYGQYSGSAYKLEGVEYKIVREDDILAVLAYAITAGIRDWGFGIRRSAPRLRVPSQPCIPLPIFRIPNP